MKNISTAAMLQVCEMYAKCDLRWFMLQYGSPSSTKLQCPSFPLKSNYYPHSAGGCDITEHLSGKVVQEPKVNLKIKMMIIAHKRIMWFCWDLLGLLELLFVCFSYQNFFNCLYHKSKDEMYVVKLEAMWFVAY